MMDTLVFFKKMNFKISIFNLREALKETEETGEGARVKMQLPGKDELYSEGAERQQYDMALSALHLKTKQTVRQVNQLHASNYP